MFRPILRPSSGVILTSIFQATVTHRLESWVMVFTSLTVTASNEDFCLRLGPQTVLVSQPEQLSADNSLLNYVNCCETEGIIIYS
jgi:hypothetical protein